ncbi:MAG: hypothetical protein KAI47_25305 [Deltaproteobacteria bacterium]|nr:hypothetical protein [Deltaproteobacteria bacterium]
MKRNIKSQRQSLWTASKFGLGASLLGAVVLVGGLLAGCGGRDVDGAVLARNLQSGETQTFASPSDVPPEFFVCPDPSCTLPPTVPCEKLGNKACGVQPECRLHILWCEGGGVTPVPVPGGTPGNPSDGNSGSEPADPSGGGVTPEENCHYECIPQTPLLCEELKDEKACSGRSDCGWQAIECMLGCEEGKPCPPCVGGTCVKKAPAQCSDIQDVQHCGARSDCEWQAAPCLPGATCTAGACVPKHVYPCPMMPSPGPDFCKGGVTEPRFNDQGCVVGYTCVMPTLTCDDLDAAYRKVLKKARECNPFTMSMVPQCEKQVPGALYCPLCPVFINGDAGSDLKELNALQAEFTKRGCGRDVICPALACQPVSGASCEYDSGSQKGFCVATTSMP